MRKPRLSKRFVLTAIVAAAVVIGMAVPDARVFADEGEAIATMGVVAEQAPEATVAIATEEVAEPTLEEEAEETTLGNDAPSPSTEDGATTGQATQDATSAGQSGEAQSTEAPSQEAPTEETGETTDQTTDETTSQDLMLTTNVVTASVAARPASGTYQLYWYALIPGADSEAYENPDGTWFGLGVSTISGVTNPASLSVGTDITGTGTISHTAWNGYTLFPDLTWNGVTYKYAEAGSANASKQGYYTISHMRTRVANGANAGNNQYNPVVAYSTHTYHIDHTIVLNEKNFYTVQFAVRYPGETDFSSLGEYAKRVEHGTAESSLTKPSYNTPDEFKETIVRDGVTYRFDGWYTDESCTTKATFAGSITANTIYYGRYVPELGNLTISKTVSGSAANVNDTFTFELSCADLANKSYSGVSFNGAGIATLTLRHGQSVTLQDLPAGVTVLVREVNLRVQAKTSATACVNGGAETTIKSEGSTSTSTDQVQAAIAEGKTTTVQVNNAAQAVPDTGVTVNAAPMAGLLATSVMGGAALAVGTVRRRCRDEEEGL
jgi:hypothetical protein